jgi:hypothetical protein
VTEKKDILTSAPPTPQVTISGKFHYRSCGGPPHVADSIRLQACLDANSRQYDPQILAYAKARDEAPNMKVAADAKAAYERTLAQKTAAAVATCTPIDDAIGKKSEATFKRIIDVYKKASPASSLDRAKALVGQAPLRPPR